VKKFVILLVLCCFLCVSLSANEQTNTEDGIVKDGIVPLSLLFHDIGWNVLHAVTYNYGLNFAAAGLETALLIDTGIDWQFRNFAYEHQALANAGVPAMYIGYGLPFVVPVATYLSGRILKDERMQIAGLALTQAFGITFSLQSLMKMTTGRAQPGIVAGHGHSKIDTAEDFSDKFNWFAMNFVDGWPSGHTANAFTMATVISEIYYDKPLLVAGAYAYAVFVGASMSVSVHWLSEVFAGVLIGFAVGKTVGKSYRNLMESRAEEKRINLYALGNGIGVSIRW
jgi:membrane-associated phospholipid phosphatase